MHKCKWASSFRVLRKILMILPLLLGISLLGGTASALDITGMTLMGGKRIMLPNDWSGDGAEARFMRQAHTAACGVFTTVLGPDANALHADHLHLDLGCHGTGCTAMICE